MNKNWRFLALSSLLAFLLAFVPPIEKGKLKVSGKIKNSFGERLEGVKVIVTDSLGRQVLDTFRTNNRGAYAVDFEFQNKYRLYFEKEGFYKVFFVFNTKVPFKKELLDYYYSPLAEIMLSDSFELNERAFRKNPITEIAFYEYYDQFRQDDKKLQAYLDALLMPNVGALIVKGQLDSPIDSIKSGVKIYAVSQTGEVLDSSYSDSQGNYEIETPLQEEGVLVKFESPKIHNTFYKVNSKVDTSFSKAEEYVYEHITAIYPKADSSINTRAFKRPNHQIAFDTSKASFLAIKPIEDEFIKKLKTPVYNNMKFLGQLLAENDKATKATKISVFDLDSNLIATKTINPGDSTFNLNLPINKNLRVVFNSPGFHESFIQLDSRVNDEKLNVLQANVTLFDTLNDAHNPEAFKRPAEKHFYNDATGKFEEDKAVAEVFKRSLSADPNEVDPTGEIQFAGTTRDSQGKKIANVELVFVEDGIEAYRDTSDSKGRYEMRLKLNKRYRMYCSKDGYYKHFMDIDTRVPKAQYEEVFVIEPPIIMFSKSLPEITNPVGFEQLPFESLSYSKVESQFTISATAFDELRDVVTRAPFEQLAESDTSGLDKLPTLTAENTFLTVKGKIKDMIDKRLKDVQVFLMDENDIIQITASDNTGSYELDAPYDKSLEVKFMDDDYFEAYFELVTDADSSYKNRELNLEDMVLYARANKKINPLAFTEPTNRFIFDPIADALSPDPKVRYEFNRLLETPLDKPLLTLSGRVKKNYGGYMNNVKVYLQKDSVIIDSALTNRKGEYQINVPYNDKYALRFVEDKHHSTFITVDTRTALEEVDLRKEEHIAETVELFKINDESVEESSFVNAFSEVNFNPVTGGFLNRAGVRERFLASVFKPIVEKEEVLAGGSVNFKEIEAEEVEVEEKGINELLERYKDRAEQHKLAKNRNEVKDSRYRLAASMMLNDTTNYARIENVLLRNKSINNVKFETFLPNLDRQANRREVADVSESTKRMNDIARSVSLSLRKGSLLDTIAIDSVFQVLRDVRVFESEYGGNIHKVEKYVVKYRGNSDEYAVIWDWWFFPTYLKNKQEIEEEQFTAELDALRKRAKI